MAVKGPPAFLTPMAADGTATATGIEPSDRSSSYPQAGDCSAATATKTAWQIPRTCMTPSPLCAATSAPTGRIIDIESAVFSYNHSDEYVQTVLDWARTYTGPLSSAARPVTGYALPVSPDLLDDKLLTRPHHDYPAWDLGLPIRTPVFAMTAGTVTTASSAGVYPIDPNRCGTTVTLSGLDGATYTYCHLSQLAVHPGQILTAGTLIGLSGGQPGTPGAGNTTGPHLHLGIRINGVSVCPQPLLLAITLKTPINPAVAPSAGCVTGRTLTDWPSWINQIGLHPQGEEDATDPRAS